MAIVRNKKRREPLVLNLPADAARSFATDQVIGVRVHDPTTGAVQVQATKRNLAGSLTLRPRGHAGDALEVSDAELSELRACPDFAAAERRGDLEIIVIPPRLVLPISVPDATPPEGPPAVETRNKRKTEGEVVR